MQPTQQRQQAILALLQERSAGSQEELLERLKARGFVATQATLSRDLRALKIAKIQGEGYVLPRGTVRHQALSGSAVSLAFSGNLGVVKTGPGFANAVAMLIDGAALPEVLGTLAGDDTVLVILREGVPSEAARASLATIFPQLV